MFAVKTVMVTCKLWAQTGNQMFMIAATYAYSLRHNMNYFVPETKYSNYFPLVIKGIPGNERYYYYKEKAFNYHPIVHKDNIRLEGYFQSHRYFKDFHKEVTELFNFPHLPMDGWASIHWRLGDYLKYPDRFPVVTKSYFEKAMEILHINGCSDFLCFSDGIDQMKSLLNEDNYPKYRFRYSEGNSELEDMILMSNCEHGIISNSSYSLMARILCRNDNSINISPSSKNWFGKGLELNTKDIIPDTFIQLPTDG